MPGEGSNGAARGLRRRQPLTRWRRHDRMTEAEIGTLIRDYGLFIIAPLAVLEGPVVSVVAGYLVKLGLLGAPLSFVVLVLGDLLGDVMLYSLGRQGRARVALPWLSALGVTRRRLARLLRAFRVRGGRILILGKLTHAAGFAVLLAAGMARMPFARFLGLSLLATLLKVAVLMALGWFYGRVADRVGNWVLAGSLLLVLCLLGLCAGYLIRRRRRIA